MDSSTLKNKQCRNCENPLDRFEVIVKNLSQPLKFWAYLGCLLRLYPKDGVRIIFKHPDHLTHFRVRNSSAGFVQIGSIVFELFMS